MSNLIPTEVELRDWNVDKLEAKAMKSIDTLEKMSQRGDKQFVIKGIVYARICKMCWAELRRRAG